MKQGERMRVQIVKEVRKRPTRVKKLTGTTSSNTLNNEVHYTSSGGRFRHATVRP